MKTTIYFSVNIDVGEYPYEALYNALESLKLSINKENRTLSFNGLLISYRLRHRKAIQRYVLTFSLDRPASQLTVSETTQRYNQICGLIDFFPPEITVGTLKFTREEIKDEIDIGEWSITNPYSSQEVSIFDNYNLQKLKDEYAGKIPLKPIFIQLDNSDNASVIINTLKTFFSDNPEVIEERVNLVRDIIDGRADKNRIFVIIIYSADINDSYIKLKKYFLQNNIPSQFINMDDKKFFFKTKNLIPEMLTKASCYPFKFPENISTVDGYICLNDVYDERNPLFGINITYNTEENVFHNKIKVYSDIKYNSDWKKINFDEGNVNLLVQKITSLSPELKGKTINVYLTKYWKYTNLKTLQKKLKEAEIKINKVFNISFFSDKFVFQGMDSLDKTKIPFLIKDKYVAYIQPNTRIGLFGSLFPISLELSLRDSEEEIIREDIEEYLWLIKRRVYRLQYIDMLRYPEFLAYSKKIKELKLSEEELSQLTFSGDLLI
ncbi:hypothetical protein COV18_02220 [Candidatus Woesearchaeota archaeon CG10_big_fil_rev_8_21_14_0_10_37_12]|nr:MAG: hypothetical protein COV18_02220 [Candidatus Woesearchaeota archaeon CG10_big_fil_rev_8_21_14_0_10_37_12]